MPELKINRAVSRAVDILEYIARQKGEIMLATYPLEKVRCITGGGSLQSHTPNTRKNFLELIRDLESIRARGYSIDDREDNEYVFCVACPLLDASGQCIAAISISCIYTAAVGERLSLYSRLITSAALDISQRLGYLKPYLFTGDSYGLF